MSRALRNTNLILVHVLIILALIAPSGNADQWKVSNRGSSYPMHRQAKGGYNMFGGGRNHYKRRLDKKSRAAKSRAEYDVETSSGRRLTERPDACTTCLCYYRKGKHYLDCSLAEVDALPINIPLDISRIWLSGQGLTDFGITNRFEEPLPKLRELLLNGNAITEISADAFVNVTNLRMLLLHYNDISDIPDLVFANMTRLKYLWLNNAGIQTVGNQSFLNLTKLEELRLSGNNISSFADEQFKGLGQLRELKLHDQEGRSLSPGCCELCAVNYRSVEMNNYGDESSLDMTASEYGNLECAYGSICGGACGSASVTYTVSSASSLYNLATGALASMCILAVSYCLSRY